MVEEASGHGCVPQGAGYATSGKVIIINTSNNVLSQLLIIHLSFVDLTSVD